MSLENIGIYFKETGLKLLRPNYFLRISLKSSSDGRSSQGSPWTDEKMLWETRGTKIAKRERRVSSLFLWSMCLGVILVRDSAQICPSLCRSRKSLALGQFWEMFASIIFVEINEETKLGIAKVHRWISALDPIPGCSKTFQDGREETMVWAERLSSKGAFCLQVKQLFT